MRLHLLLSKVGSKTTPVPSKCRYADCTSKQIRLHHQVEVHRYRCFKCRHTFRVYPPGVTHAQSKAVGVEPAQAVADVVA